MFPIFKLFVDFVPRIEKNTSFDNFSEELLYPSKKSPVYSTLPCSKLILSKASDFLDKNLVPEKPYVLFSDKVVLIDTTKPIEMLSLFIPLQEQPFVLFDGFIPLLSNSALDLDYFKKIYAKDGFVINNLVSFEKQYISLCDQFDVEITDSGFDNFIFDMKIKEGVS